MSISGAPRSGATRLSSARMGRARKSWRNTLHGSTCNPSFYRRCLSFAGRFWVAGAPLTRVTATCSPRAPPRERRTTVDDDWKCQNCGTEPFGLACGCTEKHVDEAISRARREARVEALEEAAKWLETDAHRDDTTVRRLAAELRGRALATDAPQHSNPPPGYAPCTRESGHEGPCAHPFADAPEGTKAACKDCDGTGRYFDASHGCSRSCGCDAPTGKDDER